MELQIYDSMPRSNFYFDFKYNFGQQRIDTKREKSRYALTHYVLFVCYLS